MTCIEKRTTQRGQCLAWKDEGSQKCSQQEDDGYNSCAQYKDEGYSSCQSWSPIFRWLCLGWYWVSNWVCKAWVWVSNLVCQAWAQLTYIVCTIGAWIGDTFGVPAPPRVSDDGWLVLGSDGQPSRTSTGNQVILLVDGKAAALAAANAIRGARTSIRLLQLDIDTDFVADFDQPGMDGGVLVQLLLEANRRDVSVRILLNQNLVVPDSVDAITDFFKDQGENTVIVRPFPLAIEVMHAKLMVVDGTRAFIWGLPFQQGYWDTPAHPLDEPHRTPEAIGIWAPIHTVTIEIRGPAVAAIDELFVQLWNDRSDEEFHGADKLEVAPAPPAATGTTTMLQVTRTLPAHVFSAEPRGERAVLEAYERAILRARRFIYIEDQYFNNPRIMSALVGALKATTDLELVLLINEHPDIPTYAQWQRLRLARSGLLRNPMVGIFSLWRTAPGERLRIKKCYCEAKGAVVDDTWATIGTANLDGASLDRMDEFALPWLRNVEINATVLDAGDQPAHDPRLIRTTLWAEHLGVEAGTLKEPPAGGWLGLWRSVAQANVASLNSPRPSMRGHVLPYRQEVSARGQLRALGIDLSRLDVQ